MAQPSENKLKKIFDQNVEITGTLIVGGSAVLTAETDPGVPSHVKSITTTNISNWDSAYSYSQVGHLPLTGGTLTGNLTVPIVYTTSNGSGTNIRLGDDAWLGDINLGNTTRLSGQQDPTKGYLTFGNVSNTALGRDGSGNLKWGSNDIIHAGNISSQSVAYADNSNLLDNLNSTQFLRSDVADTMSGQLTLNTGSYNPLRLDRTGSNNVNISFWHSNNLKGYLGVGNDGLLTFGGSADSSANSVILHSTNYSSYITETYINNLIPNDYLPLTGGTLTGGLNVASGNVGIGTVSPQAKMQVKGAQNTTVFAINDGSAGEADRNLFFRSYSNGVHWDINSQGAAGSFGVLSFSTNSAERMRITSSGRVGIGTTNPQDALDIDWDTEGVATDNSGIRVRAYRPHLNLIDRSGYSTSNGHNFQIKADVAQLQFNTTSADDEFFDLTRMVIDSAGDVGIGTTSPSAKLDVSGGILANEYKLASSANNGRFIGNADWGTRHYTDSGYIHFGPANSGHAHIYTDRPNFYLNKEILINNNIVWNAGNDGSGSGLDADLLDGLHGAQFLRSDVDDTMSGTLNLNGYIQNNPIQGEWYSQIPHAYIGGVNYYKYIKIANLISATSTASIEYIIKRDSNYPGVVRGTIQVSSYSSASMSVQHDQTTGNGQIGPEVYIDNNRDVWIRGNGAAWYSFLRWRAIQNSGVAILDGSTNQNTQPANSTIIPPGYSRKFAWNNAASYTDYDNTNTFKRVSTVDLTASNVGIGTTSPTQKLDVNGNVNIDGTLYSNRASLIRNETSSVPLQLVSNQVGNGSGSVGIEFGYDIYGYRKGAILFQSSDGAARGSLIFATNNSTSGANATIADERMRIDSSGRVGIGTSSPSAKLDVSGYVKIDSYSAGTTVAHNAGYLKIESQGKTGWAPGDEMGKIEFYVADGSGIGARNAASIRAVNNSGNGTSTTTFEGELAFYTSQFNAAESERMRINSSGTVQTNVTKPLGSATANLRLKTTFTGTNYSSGAYANIVFGDETITNSYLGDIQVVQGNPSASTESTMRFLTNSGGGNTATQERMRIDSSGNVGIGTTTPVGKLNVALPADSDGNVAAWSSNQVVFTRGGTNTSQGLGFSVHDSANSATISSLTPAITWSDLVYRALNHSFYSNGGTLAMYLNSSGNVGIGTSSPSAKLDVAGDAYINGDLTVNGNQIYLDNAPSRTKLMVWSGSSYGIGMESGYTYGHINNDYVMSFQMSNTDGRGFWWGDTGHSNAQGAMSLTTTGKLTVATSLNVGYGESVTAPPTTYALDVTGTIRATGDIIAYSDARVKENVNTIENALDKVNQLRGVEYNKIGDDKQSIGVIAQEIEKVLPQVVHEDSDGMKSVAYGNIVGVLIEAVKDLSNKVEELEKKINGTTSRK